MGGGRVAFILGIHNHQPVGNFDHVIEETYQKAYRPFLEAVSRHPKVKLSVHVSGCLWDWILVHRPEFIDLLKPMVARGQVEMVSGAYQEPIFPIIPADDLVGQVGKLTAFLGGTFGRTPTGAWLTERVWEPHLPALLKTAGISYTGVDDWHLKGAGLAGDALHHAYRTDHLGAGVTVIPIDEKLRYIVPFKEPEEILAHLKSVADAAAPGELPVAALLDDGEKFGGWPETHTWVYTKGWLDRFLTALDGAGDWLQIMTCAEYLERTTPHGPLYMGTASYSEMMEWALPPAGQKALADAHATLKAAGTLEAAGPFLKGGTWRNFQMKYPEANWLHKKMLRVSAKVAAVTSRAPEDPRAADAREALWRGQCNCPYWHGVFGGLYLNYLRYAVWHNLIEAERLADEMVHGAAPWIDLTQADLDGDGSEEIVVDTERFSALVRPAEGGSITSWEVRRKGWNELDTLARRPEAYHARLVEAIRSGSAADPAAAAMSIHELVRVKEPGLDQYLKYDAQKFRGALHDHWLAHEATFAAFKDADTSARMPLVHSERGLEHPGKRRKESTIVLLGHAMHHNGTWVGEWTKELKFSSQGVRVIYRIKGMPNAERLDVLLAIEWNIGLLAGDAPDRYLLADGTKPADPRACSEGEFTATTVEAVDGWQRARVRFVFERPTRVWRMPVWTVSQSEGGFERTYQSTALYFLVPVSLAPDAMTSFSFTHDVLDLES